MFIYYINILSYTCRVFIAQMKQIKYNYEKLAPFEQFVLLIVLLSGAATCIICWSVGLWTWEKRDAIDFLYYRPTDEQINKYKKSSWIKRFAINECIRQIKEKQRELDEYRREYMINEQKKIMANKRITAKLKRLHNELTY